MTILGGKAQKAEINVTPLIDVLLVLLIIFMIITPLRPTGLYAVVPQPPQSDQHQHDVLDDIVITVCAGRTIRINQEPVEFANLEPRLKRLFASNVNHPLFVRAEPDLQFGEVAQVIDVARGAGLTRIALMPR